MGRSYIIFFAIAVAVFAVDQYLKWVILEGFRWSSECISIILTYNKGVAFSMFAFLGEYLKYIQSALLLGVLIYSLRNRAFLKDYALPMGIVFGAGVGNVIDRFFREGVVDYVFWHCYFDFAVFNFADAMIDVAIALILLKVFLNRNKAKI